MRRKNINTTIIDHAKDVQKKLAKARKALEIARELIDRFAPRAGTRSTAEMISEFNRLLAEVSRER